MSRASSRRSPSGESQPVVHQGEIFNIAQKGLEPVAEITPAIPETGDTEPALLVEAALQIQALQLYLVAGKLPGGHCFPGIEDESPLVQPDGWYPGVGKTQFKFGEHQHRVEGTPLPPHLLRAHTERQAEVDLVEDHRLVGADIRHQVAPETDVHGQHHHQCDGGGPKESTKFMERGVVQSLSLACTPSQPCSPAPIRAERYRSVPGCIPVRLGS